MIDADNLMRGQDYLELKESFVIFITTFDPFGYEMPVYTFKNICKENTKITLQDETSKIFFNATAYKKFLGNCSSFAKAKLAAKVI